MSENPLKSWFVSATNRLAHSDRVSIVSAETPSQRADLIIENWEKAIKRKRFSGQELASFVDVKEPFEDSMQVYLGLKPMAGFLSHVMHSRYPSFYREGFRIDRILSAIPKDDRLGILVLTARRHSLLGPGDIEEVWNPEAVNQVLKDNEDLSAGKQIDPFDLEKFPSAVMSLVHRPPFSSKDVSLQGLIYGYPKAAATSFGDIANELAEVCIKLTSNAQDKGLQLFNGSSNATPMQQIVMVPELKQRLIDYASDINYPISDKLRYYILNSRAANAPGFNYGTLEGLTDTEEAEQRQKWEESGIIDKVGVLLKKYLK